MRTLIAAVVIAGMTTSACSPSQPPAPQAAAPAASAPAGDTGGEGKQLEIEYTMTDPEHWEGEWKSTKRFNRVDDEDIQEVSCLPDLNEHIRSTTSKTQILQ